MNICSFFIFIILFFVPQQVFAQSKPLVVALANMPKTLDPFQAVDANGMRITQQLLFEALVQLDNQLQVTPALAERWETPSPTTYLFTLRENLKTPSGQSITAEDVQYSFEYVMNPENRSPFQFLATKIKSIEVLDSRTVEFSVIEPQASFLLDLFIPIVKRPSPEEENVSTWEGAGPYRLEQKSASEIVLASNPLYYGGSAKIDRIIFKGIQDDNTRFLKMKKGDIDLAVNTIPLDKLRQFHKNPLKKMYQVIEETGLSFQYLGLNVEHPILRNLQVRQALAHALNKKELIQFFKKNHASAARSLLTPNNSFYYAVEKEYAFDLKKAEALLDTAGFPKKNGTRFSLEYKTTTNRDAIRQARIIQSQLKKVGIDLQIRSFEWGTFFSDVKSGNFAIFSLRWVGVTEPDFYYALFHSSQFPPNGRNRVRYQNPKLDPLLEKGRVELDFVKRKEIYDQVQTILAHDLPYINLWHNNNIVIIKRNLVNFQLHATGGFHAFKEMSWK